MRIEEEAKRREIISKAFEDAGEYAESKVITSWLRYSYEKNLSGEELYDYVRNAVELMKKYHFYRFSSFTPESYEVVKRAEEKGLRKTVERIVKAGIPKDFDEDVIKEWIRLVEDGWDYDLIAIYYCGETGEKYVPIFSYNLDFLSEKPSGRVWLSRETKEVVEEVSQEENVEAEALESEVKSQFLKRAYEWVKEAEEDRKKVIDTALKIEEKGRYPFHVWKRLFVPPKTDAFLGYFDGEKVKVAVDWSSGVVYAEKKDWEDVRKWLKEEVEKIAKEMGRSNNNFMGVER